VIQVEQCQKNIKKKYQSRVTITSKNKYQGTKQRITASYLKKKN
jgi:hypothetical protein